MSFLRDYQKKAARFAVDVHNPYLAMEVGLGKTLTALAVIKHYSTPETLVIGTKNIIKYTWPEEIERWTPDITYAVVTGTPKQRLDAVNRAVDMHLINYENLVWLINNVEWKWPLVVFDEMSKMKSRGERVKAFCGIRKKIYKVIALSGTPAANDLLALFPQYLCLDNGVTFGPHVTKYRDRFFVNRGRKFPDWQLRPGAGKVIMELAKKSMLTMRSCDYLKSLPEVTTCDLKFELKDKNYKQLEKEFVLSFDGNDILAPSAAVKSMKLRQVASGFIYDNAGNIIGLNKDKLETFAHLMDELAGEQVLIFYNFKAEKDVLSAWAKPLDPDKWNKKQIRVMMAHPQSAGHGLNLQKSGAKHIVFFSLPWDAELYIQCIGRLKRPGNTSDNVFVHRLIARNTIEVKVARTLREKLEQHERMMG